MTQNGRVKWILWLAASNLAVAAAGAGLVARRVFQASTERAALIGDLDAARAEARDLRRKLTEAQPNLSETLQVVAREQEVLLLRMLQQPPPQPTVAAPARLETPARAPQARRARRRARSTVCKR